MTRTVRLLFVVIVAVFVAHAIFLSCVAEDAFITFRYAKHLAGGHGFVWNIGEAPVEGYTNFLWLLVCALITTLGWELPRTAQGLGVLASILVLGYTYRYATDRLRIGALYALIPCLFLALSGPFATWATSGMETNLFTLFVVMGGYGVTGYWQTGGRRTLAVGCVALLLASLTRPEGCLVFGLLVVLGAVLALGRRKSFAEAGWIVLLAYLAPFLAYFVWRYQYFGMLLPTTFYAKTGGSFFQYYRGLRYIGLFAVLFLVPLTMPVLLAAWEAGRAHVRQRWSRRALIRRLESHIGIWTCSLIAAVYSLYIVYVGGDYMAMFRFFVPLLPFIYLLVGLAAARTLQAASGSGRRLIARGVLAVAVAVPLLQSTPIEQKLFAKASFMHGTYRGVETERFYSNKFQFLGRFFRAYRASPEESLALQPIGAIGYYADMKIHSVYGIVDPHIARMRVPAGTVIGLGFPGHEKRSFAYVLSKQPTYILFSKGFPKVAKPFPAWLEEIDSTVRDRYRKVDVWLTNDANKQQGYWSFLELKSVRSDAESAARARRVAQQLS